MVLHDARRNRATRLHKFHLHKRILSAFGPGLIAGASDDDPSGIGTYSQAGAQFGFGMCWTMLFSYPLMVIKLDWLELARGVFVPSFSSDSEFWTTVVAVLGTTISPYLFFWQAAQECEDIRADPQRQALRKAPRQGASAIDRIRADTYI